MRNFAFSTRERRISGGTISLKTLSGLSGLWSPAPRAIGYAIFLTNDDNYWRETRRRATFDGMFRIHENSYLKVSFVGAKGQEREQ